MILTKAIATVVTAGILTVGGAGAAFAATTPPNPPALGTTAPSVHAKHAHQRCRHAQQRLDRLERRKSRIEARLDRLNKALQVAKQHNNTALVQKIEARIDRANKLHEAVIDRINKIKSTCHL